MVEIEGCLSCRRLIRVVNSEFTDRELFILVVLSVSCKCPQSIFHNSVYSFSHAIRLRVIGRAHLEINAKSREYFLEEN